MNMVQQHTEQSTSAPDDMVRALFRSPDETLAVVKIAATTDPSGRPFYAITISADRQRNTSDLTHADLTNSALTKGKGIAVFSEDQPQRPLASYRYGEILSLAIFGSLRPDDRLDPSAHPQAFSSGVPAGTKVRQSTPNSAIFPDYAKNAIANHLADVVGRPVTFVPQLIEYPELDNLIRFKLVIDGFAQMPQKVRDAIGQRAAWCLPYALLL
jgi:hypothetical protein